MQWLNKLDDVIDSALKRPNETAENGVRPEPKAPRMYSGQQEELFEHTPQIRHKRERLTPGRVVPGSAEQQKTGSAKPVQESNPSPSSTPVCISASTPGPNTLDAAESNDIAVDTVPTKAVWSTPPPLSVRHRSSGPTPGRLKRTPKSTSPKQSTTPGRLRRRPLTDSSDEESSVGCDEGDIIAAKTLLGGGRRQNSQSSENLLQSSSPLRVNISKDSASAATLQHSDPLHMPSNKGINGSDSNVLTNRTALPSDPISDSLSKPLSDQQSSTRLQATPDVPSTVPVKDDTDARIESLLPQASMQSVLSPPRIQKTSSKVQFADDREVQSQPMIEPDTAALDVGGGETGQAIASETGNQDIVDSDDSAVSAGQFDSDSLAPSLPRSVEFRSEYDVGECLPSWKPSGIIYEDKMNCYGVIHVRVLRAQRLSCPVGTSVQAVVSLLPWKGKVRTEKATSFSSSSSQHGVCVRWGEEAVPLSVVHSYSSQESPLPRLNIDLIFNPLGVFEFRLCTLVVSCQELIAAPLYPRRQWFAAQTDTKGVVVTMKSPAIEIEAMFEPGESSRYPRDEPEVPMVEIEVGSEDSLTAEEATLPTPSAKASVGSNVVQGSKQLSESQRFSIKADEYSQTDSTMRAESKIIPSNAHLLRVKTHWSPATCCVCKKSIMAGLWKKKSFHCEVCSVDCCSDCQLQVDIQLPCGSEQAEKARVEAVQNKFTVDNILNVVAPMDEASMSKLANASERSVSKVYGAASASSAALHDSHNVDESGIGKMKFEFIRAVVFEQPLPAESDVEGLLDADESRLKKGDYYVRVAWTGSDKTGRTRTIQNTGRPTFDSGLLLFNVLHYGTEFRIELVDAGSDKPVGWTVITTQTMLQMQRDSLINEYGVLSLFLGPSKLPKTIRLVLELRCEMKNGFSTDFFVPQKPQSSHDDKSKPGDVVGIMELLAGMEEDVKALFSDAVYECPPRPAEKLNMSMIPIHLARLSSLIDDVKKLIEGYHYVVSWQNPFVTGLSMSVFVRCCLNFDPAYFGSFPVSLAILAMASLAVGRLKGRLRNRLVLKEIEQYRKVSDIAVEHNHLEGRLSQVLQALSSATVDYTLHRPTGMLSVCVQRGRNLVSPELGLPGNVGCRVYWDPMRFLDSDEKGAFVSVDKAGESKYDIGSTNFQYSSSPSWTLLESDLSKRLRQLLPGSGSDDSFFEPAEKESAGTVVFPILQPFKVGEGAHEVLQPWNKSPAAIVAEVKFNEALSFLPGAEYTLGEVVIPFADVAVRGEFVGWFQVLEAGTNRVVPVESDSNESGSPQIFVKLEWKEGAPENDSATDTERLASLVIQEEMLRSAMLSKEQKLGVVGASLGAFTTMRGLSDNLLLVQNTLSSVLDTVGSIRNLFNFTDPFKSSIVLAVLTILWGLLSIVPTRVIIFAGGMAQYALTFVSRYGRISKGGSKDEVDSINERRPKSHYKTWFLNAVRGLPNDEDIRKTYFWECRRRRARLLETQAEAKRAARLKDLWKAQWYSRVYVLCSLDSQIKRLNSFAMIQGHRFLWWRSVADFDKGELPAGRIFLAGHSGLATPSPLEVKSIERHELARTVSIFGRGTGKQEKVTVIVPAEHVKEELERAITSASSTKND